MQKWSAISIGVLVVSASLVAAVAAKDAIENSVSDDSADKESTTVTKVEAAPSVEAQHENIKKQLAKTLPGIEVDNIVESPIPGVYEVMVGTQIAYVSADGKYLIQGSIFDLDSNENVTEQRLGLVRNDIIKNLNDSKMVVFGPKKPKHTVTVFTDIDCGYCRKLHNEMSQFNELGIKVRYMFYPRSGPNTESWIKAENVWCANDRREAMTKAKNGEDVTSKQCDASIVAEHYQTGRMMGLRGTPAILLESGELVQGYLPAEQLLARL
ncbi:MAG: DsbC family protein [Gammaproteobacteria bacterium]|nr:DsbC family protein [Gammaproteobacteria bacterium]